MTNLLKSLTDFPHRGVGSAYETQAADLLKKNLQAADFETIVQPFTTPKTYATIVWLGLAGIIFGLFATGLIKWFGVLFILKEAYDMWCFLDWRYSILINFFWQKKSQNIIGRFTNSVNPTSKIVLMAHYDSAPVSALYKKQTANGFRNTVRLSMLMLLLCVPLGVLLVLYPTVQWLHWVKYGFVFYFVVQGITSTIGYFTQGFVNGASDNATGVVAAMATAERLKNQLQHTTIEVVLTSAEEVGMIGAYYYWKEKFDKNTPTWLINFDTLGAGSLKLITKTGSWTTIHYDNAVTQTAQQVMQTDARFANVTTGQWHTADFDSVWFVRAGVACVTLAALDHDGLMPRIHRREDILENVDIAPMLQAIDLAEAVAIQLERNANPLPSRQ